MSHGTSSAPPTLGPPNAALGSSGRPSQQEGPVGTVLARVPGVAVQQPPPVGGIFVLHPAAPAPGAPLLPAGGAAGAQPGSHEGRCGACGRRDILVLADGTLRAHLPHGGKRSHGNCPGTVHVPAPLKSKRSSSGGGGGDDRGNGAGDKKARLG